MRQRQKFRRSAPRAAGAEGQNGEGGEVAEDVRAGDGVRVRLHPASGTALRRTLGGGRKGSKGSAAQNSRQRQPHGRRAEHDARRGGGSAELQAANRPKQRSQRRRSAHPRSLPDRRTVAGPASGFEPGHSLGLFETMASCLVSQAAVLAAMVKGLSAATAAAQQMVPGIPNLGVGELVLVHEDGVGPQQWLLGRVTKVVEGKDQKVRVAEVNTKNGNLQRPNSPCCQMKIQVVEDLRPFKGGAVKPDGLFLLLCALRYSRQPLRIDVLVSYKNGRMVFYRLSRRTVQCCVVVASR